MAGPFTAILVSLRRAGPWRRALQVGLPVGLLQVAVNQGHHWLSGHPPTEAILRSLLSVTVSFLVALLSASLATHDASHAP